MRMIDLDAAVTGDVLARDVFVNDVYLFGAGTVLNDQRLGILRELKVPEAAIEDRAPTYGSLKEVFVNIDARFSYAGEHPQMQHLRMWIKEYVANAHADKTNA